MSEILVDVQNLKKYFPIKKGVFSKTIGYVKAVDDVSFQIKKGETLGLVGESGCGKTTIGRSLLRLIEPTSGKVIFEGKDVTEMKSDELKRIRKDMQIIFQDPYSSLNPRMTVGGMITEILKFHQISEGEKAEKRVMELLEIVGLSKLHARRYPHEFSGGQRQRIGVARALSVEPKFIVCDEPVSALDVSIQSQIINLLQDLQKEFHLTYLFISHDLSVVEHISDRVAVMYLGQIVEVADCVDLYKQVKHPYSEALLSAVPIPDPKAKRMRIILQGDVPSPSKVPTGCYFHPRCPKIIKGQCEHIEPVLASLNQSTHEVKCLLYPESYPTKDIKAA
jgi:peptide/nickel transport system ATP-binding protein